MALQHNSIWNLTSKREKRFPALAGHASTEIAVVGGGIAGLTCAYHLSRAGKKVVLVEAERIGSGTTGHSTGNLYGLIEESLYQLELKWGNSVASEVVESRLSAVDTIEEIVSVNKINCDFRRVNFSYFTENASEKTKSFLHHEAAAAESLGFKIKMADSAASLPFPTKFTLEIQNQAQFNPLSYVRALAELLTPKVQIYENSRVTEIDTAGGLIKCENGEVKAEKIIMATHIPKGSAAVQLRLSAIREHGMAALLKSNAFPGTFWRMDESKRSIRTVSVDGRHFVIVIGEKFKTGHNAETEKENEELDRYISERFDVGFERYWWSAQSYRSADYLPIIDENDKVYYLTGFSSDGLVYGTLGAGIIADRILGKQNNWEHLYKSDHRSFMKSSKEIIKEGFDNFCQYAKDFPKTGTTNLHKILPGEGAIIESAGEKIAVYKDENNQIHAVSAVCTHMKCIVTFNSAEKSWDCPCHASRFATNGKVLEGPALQNLEMKYL